MSRAVLLFILTFLYLSPSQAQEKPVENAPTAAAEKHEEDRVRTIPLIDWFLVPIYSELKGVIWNEEEDELELSSDTEDWIWVAVAGAGVEWLKFIPKWVKRYADKHEEYTTERKQLESLETRYGYHQEEFDTLLKELNETLPEIDRLVDKLTNPKTGQLPKAVTEAISEWKESGKTKKFDTWLATKQGRHFLEKHPSWASDYQKQKAAKDKVLSKHQNLMAAIKAELSSSLSGVRPLYLDDTVEGDQTAFRAYDQDNKPITVRGEEQVSQVAKNNCDNSMGKLGNRVKQLRRSTLRHRIQRDAHLAVGTTALGGTGYIVYDLFANRGKSPIQARDEKRDEAAIAEEKRLKRSERIKHPEIGGVELSFFRKIVQDKLAQIEPEFKTSLQENAAAAGVRLSNLDELLDGFRSDERVKAAIDDAMEAASELTDLTDVADIVTLLHSKEVEENKDRLNRFLDKFYTSALAQLSSKVVLDGEQKTTDWIDKEIKTKLIKQTTDDLPVMKEISKTSTYLPREGVLLEGIDVVDVGE